MRTEALAAKEQVHLLLAHDEKVYEKLGEQLRSRPPHGVLTIARGSSDHAAAYFGYLTMLRLGRLVTSFPMSLHTLYKASIADPDIVALAISQSGQSPDLREPLQRCANAGATTVALVNDTQSPLAHTAQWTFPLHAGVEQSVAATKSFICALVASARLVGHWCQQEALLRALDSLPQSLAQACTLDWSQAISCLAEANKMLVIGRGLGMAIASEAALKLKETCCIQAEAFSAAELMHGPIAVVEPNYPVLLFALRGPAQQGLLELARKLRDRGARVWLAAPADVADRNLTVATTDHEDLDPIAAIQSFYLLVEAVARARGLDPDKPRSLSKVTSTF